MNASAIAIASLTLAVAACTSVPLPPMAPLPPGSPAGTLPAGPLPSASTVAKYRCEHDIAFTVRFYNGSASIDAGARGMETLLRDAGGVTPQHTVFSSTTMKAEFGLEPEGRGAKLTYASPPLEAKCVRE